ncbi:MAG: mechanosensitive ion channel [Candidatus Lindowbacteria bacterium]|nr:mechanosensitive ion channel [Candidatus Lindowbacteria bacterium]
MLFTLVAFFDALGLPAITKPLNLFLGTILEFAPRLIGAGIIFIAALVIANIAKWAITKSASSTKIDGWIAKKTGGTPGSEEGLASGLANLVYGLVFLLFLPAILDALQMTGLLDPVKDMVSEATSVLPDLLGAAIIFYIGGFVAKIIRQITTDLSESAGVNELGTKVGVTGGDNKKLSEVLGGIVYALILIPVAVSALNTLGVDAIADPATNMLNLLLASVPKIFGACIIVSVSYIVAKFVSDLVTNILSSTGFDNVLGKIGIGKTEGLGTKTPSSIVGYLVFISIVLFSSVEAANMLGFAIVAELVAKFITFAGDISLAVVVLGLGMYFANIAHTVVSASGTSGAKISAQAARLSIIIFASAMALRQTGIADEIVTTAFSFILGGIAVGAGLAFGLGCKDIAGRGVENFLKKFE